MLKMISQVGHHLSKEQDQSGKFNLITNIAMGFDSGEIVEFSCPPESLNTLIQTLKLAELEHTKLIDKEKERVRGAVIRGLVKNNMPYSNEQVADIVERIVS